RLGRRGHRDHRGAHAGVAAGGAPAARRRRRRRGLCAHARGAAFRLHRRGAADVAVPSPGGPVNTATWQGRWVEAAAPAAPLPAANAGRFAVFEAILAPRCGLPRARLLDFGCVAGNLVRAALARGIDACGCDIDSSHKWSTEAELVDLLSTGRVRRIEGADGNESPEAGQPYRLPFDDGQFDVLVSDNVLEHVRNYPEMIAEFHRVLRPGGL